MLCDFCLTPCREAWAVTVNDFREPVYKVVNVAGQWAACDGCWPLLMARDSVALMRRITAIINSRGDGFLEEDKARRFHSLLLTNITGHPERISDQTSLPERVL